MGMTDPAPGTSYQKTDHCPTNDRPMHIPNLEERGKRPPIFGANTSRRIPCSIFVRTSPMPNIPIATGTSPNPSVKVALSNEAKGAADRVCSNGRNGKAAHGHDQPLREGPHARERATIVMPKHIKAKYLWDRTSGPPWTRRAPGTSEPMMLDCSSNEGPHGGHPEGRTRTTSARHLITI